MQEISFSEYLKHRCWVEQKFERFKYVTFIDQTEMLGWMMFHIALKKGYRLIRADEAKEVSDEIQLAGFFLEFIPVGCKVDTKEVKNETLV